MMGMFDTCSGDDCQYRRDLDTLRSDVARVTAERDAAVKEAKEIHAEWRRVAAHATTLSEQVHGMRMVIPERDALKAEVEAMRGVVEAAQQVNERLQEASTENYEDGYRTIFKSGGNDLVAKFNAALDALRTRKVGE